MLLVKKNTQCCGCRNRKRILGENFIWSYTAAKGGISALTHAQAIPSLSQAQRIRQLSKEKQLSLEKMEEIMCEVKKGEITRVAFTNEQLHKYFPNSYTPAMMKWEILALLKLWKKESWES